MCVCIVFARVCALTVVATKYQLRFSIDFLVFASLKNVRKIIKILKQHSFITSFDFKIYIYQWLRFCVQFIF